MYRDDGQPYQAEGKFWNGYRYDHFNGKAFKNLEMEEQAFIRKLVRNNVAELTNDNKVKVLDWAENKKKKDWLKAGNKRYCI